TMAWVILGKFPNTLFICLQKSCSSCLSWKIRSPPSKTANFTNVFPASTIRFMIQRSINGKKQMAFFTFLFGYPKFEIIFAPSYGKPIVYLRRAQAKTTFGALAQLVEQWTENPCVPGSIPGGTTTNPRNLDDYGGFYFWATV